MGILSLHDRKMIAHQIAVNEANIARAKANPNSGEFTADGLRNLMEDTARYKKVLQEGTPTGKDDPDKLTKEIKELETKIKEGMPTRTEMLRGESADIEKNTAWDRKQKANVLRWKELQRRREPDDPTAPNIETIRNKR